MFKIKIVNVISSCSSGGAEIFVKELVGNLNFFADSNELELWVMSRVENSKSNLNEQHLKFEREFVNELEEHGVKVRFIDKRAKKDLLKSWFRIRKLYNDFKPDIINTHLEQVTFHTIMGLLGKQARIIQTIHSVKINYPKIQKYFLKFFLKKYVSISNETTYELTKLKIKDSQIQLIENGVSLKKFSFLNRNFDLQNLKLIAIGRLVKEKNHKLILEAFKIMKEQLIQTSSNIPTLRIFGDGYLKEELLNEIIKLNLTNEVQFIGLSNDISSELTKSDIYLMGSKWEGLSISLIEAAASGLPIIATNVGSNKRIVKDGVNGYLVERDNVKEFSNKLLDIIESKEKLVQFSKASHQISKNFDINLTAQKYYQLYCKLVKN